ncbi:hypothetical protein K503DRAFT_772021 [Rhizopogon vinicolor AM-OR11-026]|uniref:Uncharacterized protein n=1 Tax=Rhizopogon vinicolor AM-OR11-026 TaxID=1314800 RepID=A0A1B7MWD2_9AGAM|nr:hypothetical protein K503DRAFT_772021 [Rhizopogon vinicolor AM-OR11-026]
MTLPSCYTPATSRAVYFFAPSRRKFVAPSIRLAHTFHAPSRTVLYIPSCAIFFRAVSHIHTFPEIP